MKKFICLFFIILLLFSICGCAKTSNKKYKVVISMKPTFKVVKSVAESDAFAFPGLVGDNMILQRNSELTLWGKYLKDGPVAAEINDKIYFGECKNNQFEINISTGKEDRPFDITIYSATEKAVIHNVLLGEVFVCAGQSNMQLTMANINAPELTQRIRSNSIRFVYVPVKTLTEPVTEPIKELPLKWEDLSNDTLASFSAVSYYFSEKMAEELNVPIGIISVSAGDTIIASWLPNTEAKALPPIFQEFRPPYFVRTPANMFNTMLSPVLKYKAKAVLWYQGENQVYKYDDFLSKLINVWRREFKNDKLGFTIIQLPRFGESWALKWAEIRDAQKNVAQTLPNCTYSVNIDLGEELNIHPNDKRPVGERAAFATLTKFYNMKNLPQSPAVKSFKIQNDKLIIDFYNSKDGLILKNDGQGFEISSDNNIFYDAVAVIENNKLILRCDEVKKPIKARYAYSNFPLISLYNKAGMPAEQFNLN